VGEGPPNPPPPSRPLRPPEGVCGKGESREVKMAVKNIVLGQKIDPKIHKAAKRLRSNQTPSEEALWRLLRKNGLDGLHFRRQQVIDSFIVDFYCHAVALAVELDGSVHDDPDQSAYDRERDEKLRQRGIRVLRIKNVDIDNRPEFVLNLIRAACLLPPFPFREGRVGEG
jgi:very-short-patch-repair endonuclease